MADILNFNDDTGERICQWLADHRVLLRDDEVVKAQQQEALTHRPRGGWPGSSNRSRRKRGAE